MTLALLFGLPLLLCVLLLPLLLGLLPALLDFQLPLLVFHLPLLPFLELALLLGGDLLAPCVLGLLALALRDLLATLLLFDLLPLLLRAPVPLGDLHLALLLLGELPSLLLFDLTLAIRLGLFLFRGERLLSPGLLDLLTPHLFTLLPLILLLASVRFRNLLTLRFDRLGFCHLPLPHLVRLPLLPAGGIVRSLGVRPLAGRALFLLSGAITFRPLTCAGGRV